MNHPYQIRVISPPLTVKSFTQPNERASRGFALIATISVMSLLIMVGIGMLSLASVSRKNAAHERPRAEAMANARMALTIALAQLQESSGHDQRITATGDSVMAPSATSSSSTSRKNWVGVWDSSTFNPNPNSSDNEKSTHFLRWLVSSSDETNITDADPTLVSLKDPLTIFDGAGVADDVEVDKISILGENGEANGSYAFWVQDNGVKASTVWSLNETGTDEEQQAARLMAAAGPDITSFTSSGSPVNEANLDTYHQGIEKLTSIDDLYLAFGSDHSYSWVKENHHDLTVFSQAVLSDTKLGGLQRDLSLAFEMDANEEAESADKFNKQEGEFVAGGDRLEEGEQTPSMPVKARLPYRDTADSNSPFASDISVNGSVMRGPTWWALRDYANLYKQVQTTSENAKLTARAYYPNNQQNINLSSRVGVFGGKSLFFQENDHRTNAYIYKPAKSNYAPMLIGSSTMISYGVSNTNKFQIFLDQLMFLWNPYNCDIECENLVLSMGDGLPGDLGIWVTKNGAGSPVTYHQNLANTIRLNVSNTVSNGINYLIKDENGGPITLKPGEIVVASTSGQQGSANLGYNWNTTSGLVLSTFKGVGPNGEDGELSVDDSDDIGYLYKYLLSQGSSLTGGANAMRNQWTTYLPNNVISPSDLTDSSAFGDELQHIHYPHHGEQSSAANTDIREFVSPEAQGSGSSSVPINSLTAGALKGSKVAIGVVTTMMKPAYWDGENPNPVEVFSRFNPMPTIVKRDYNRVCGLNQLYNFITDADPTNLMTNYGINFSAQTARSAFWGLSSSSNSSTRFPLVNIPRAPLLSLAALSHANISITANEAFRAIGNSWSSPLIDVDTTYGKIHDRGEFQDTLAQDLSWHMNDALFDRYFFSGFAGNSPNTVITSFYDGNHDDAEASPSLIPYVPEGKDADTIYADLNIDDNDDGYKRTSAYALVNGAFNINSTSVEAWSSFLRSNRNLEIQYAEGGNASTTNATPFPSGPLPSEKGNGAQEHWSGFGELSDDQIAALATILVEKIKERCAENGPFMSLSDFINRRMGDHQGILQEAIDEAGVNAVARDDVESQNGIPLTPIYEANGTSDYFQFEQDNGTPRSTATGIPGEINQADLLLPIAPRLRPRSDTFTIRAYGESLDSNGNKLAEAYCEAVVQRVPEYVDSHLNDPWDEPSDTPNEFPKQKPETSTVLLGINKTLGRKYKTLSFRWLNSDEI
ncbi:hypothetical protein [Rubritalea sp.]|uniref:hypothetical protein n=1 Tax=Rubritalea sp. TaxID=2109375 RepID=UPI003EF95746